MKKWILMLLVLAIVLMTAACKKPVGQTPYEEVSPGGEVSGEDDATGEDTPSADSSSPTQNNGQSTTSKDSGKKTTTAAKDNSVDFTWGDDEDDDGFIKVPSTTKAPTTTTTTTRPPVGQRVFPQAGDKPHAYLEITQVSVVDNEVTLSIKNVTKGFESDNTDCMYFVCYNEAGKELATLEINSGRILPGETVTKTVTVPKGTLQMVFEKYDGEFWTSGWH